MERAIEPGPIRIGTAAWALPAALRDQFPPAATLLTRYAGVFDAVEINSSFYRPHQRKTYERWAASTPSGFAFAVKAPREITHERRLVDAAEPMARFLGEIGGLGPQLGPVLMQLPPTLRFEAKSVEAFLSLWRAQFGGATVLEPRHVSWFNPQAEGLLIAYKIARAAVDPSPVLAEGLPGGWRGLEYYRLHGSPFIYESTYDAATLAHIAAKISAPAWVMFDNTKFGAATQNALTMQGLLTRRRPRLSPEPHNAW